MPRLTFIVLLLTVANLSNSKAEVLFDPDGLIRVETISRIDSVTVGERYDILVRFTYPDSLTPIPLLKMDVGKNRLMSMDWDEAQQDGMWTRTATIQLLTLDLEVSGLPEVAFDFETPAGDTLRVFSNEISIPIRMLALESTDVRPLKDQWEAPTSLLERALWAGGLVLLAALIWWLIYRRRKRGAIERPEPLLPADYVALTELTRIERLGLISDRAYKQYYTLVVDTVRHYLERRFHVETMDRTSEELIDELGRRQIEVNHLKDLLQEADLVKFARYEPKEESTAAAMHTAREIIVETTKHHRADLESKSSVGIAPDDAAPGADAVEEEGGHGVSV